MPNHHSLTPSISSTFPNSVSLSIYTHGRREAPSKKSIFSINIDLIERVLQNWQKLFTWSWKLMKSNNTKYLHKWCSPNLLSMNFILLLLNHILYSIQFFAGHSSLRPFNKQCRQVGPLLGDCYTSHQLHGMLCTSWLRIDRVMVFMFFPFMFPLLF